MKKIKLFFSRYGLLVAFFFLLILAYVVYQLFSVAYGAFSLIPVEPQFDYSSPYAIGLCAGSFLSAFAFSIVVFVLALSDYVVFCVRWFKNRKSSRTLSDSEQEVK